MLYYDSDWVGYSEFKLPVKVDKPCTTFFRVVGRMPCGTPPLVIMHGGPGLGHEYLRPFLRLWSLCGIPVIFFDHLGCSSSAYLDHIRDKSFWNPVLSMHQLDSLIDYLDIRGGPGFDLLGHGFGGMVASYWAAQRPKGLRRLILANSCASQRVATDDMRSRIPLIPRQMQLAIYEAEQNNSYMTPAYLAALSTYNQNFECRTANIPPDLQRSYDQASRNMTVPLMMNGPAAFQTTGSLAGFNAIPSLHKINIPVLVYNGEHGSWGARSQGSFRNIPNKRCFTIAGGGNMCHLEGEERLKVVLDVVGTFLKANDQDLQAS